VKSLTNMDVLYKSHVKQTCGHQDLHWCPFASNHPLAKCQVPAFGIRNRSLSSRLRSLDPGPTTSTTSASPCGNRRGRWKRGTVEELDEFDSRRPVVRTNSHAALVTKHLQHNYDQIMISIQKSARFFCKHVFLSVFRDKIRSLADYTPLFYTVLRH